MNLADVVVIAVIIAFAFIGIRHGFIKTVFKLGSFFISVLVAVKFYPAVAELLMKSSIYTELKASILKHILAGNPGTSIENAAQAQQAARSIIESLSLPGFIKDMLFSGSESKLLDYSKLAESVSDELAGLAISVLSLVLLFIAVRILLFFGSFILSGLAKLPVLKQLDKAGGLALGAVEGLLTVYILLALLTLFGSSEWFAPIHDAISQSLMAGYLYENNFIVRYVSKGPFR
jgi:uncharacterized membrane protein required for colicin V production